MAIQHHQQCINYGAFPDHPSAELASFHFIALAGVDVTAYDLQLECCFYVVKSF